MNREENEGEVTKGLDYLLHDLGLPVMALH